MTIEELRKKIEEDPSISEREKEAIMRKSEASQAISDAVSASNLTPMELMEVFTGMACGITLHCDEPFKALAYVLKCMSECYDYAQVIRNFKDKDDDDA